jgi:catecholate siderophore receptor
MNLFTLTATLCAALVAAATPATAAATAAAMPATAAATPITAAATVEAMPSDTLTVIKVDLPAGFLSTSLSALSKQAGMRIELEGLNVGAIEVRSLAGTMRFPEALRRLLDGTGLHATFVSAEQVVVRSSVSGSGSVYTLNDLLIIGSRNAGYKTERTTSATRTDTPLRDAPQSVSVITRDAIADMGMQGMSDVMRYVPGATAGQGEGNRDQVVLRGNSSTADYYLNGVRDDVQYIRDLYNVERVEALKGSNAMVFGRGGGGGVINRVTKAPRWYRTGNITFSGGSYDQRRGSIDIGDGVTSSIALRLNGVYEDSRTFRAESDMRRIGVNPAASVRLGERTAVTAGVEYFDDERTADRGVPSFNGAPSAAPIRTFFGNPDLSEVSAEVRSATALIEHEFDAGVSLRSRTRYADYNKFYQNSFPSVVNAAGTEVNLAAYNHKTDRTNLFNQTDVIIKRSLPGGEHTIATGFELSRQVSDNFRNTGYYDGSATTITVPFSAPTVATPIVFRQSATDANSRSTTNVAAGFVQDQVAFSSKWLGVAGVRYERFTIDFLNNRSQEELKRTDIMVSPRAGLIFKPRESMSLYGSYSVSYLPGSGDQFSTLTLSTKTLEPEHFINREIGVKWDVRSALALTAAVYRLDRKNTSAPDPADPTRLVQTGSQQTTGLEVGATGNITGRWQVAGGYAIQNAEVTSPTRSAREGATPALVPARSLSVWNRYQAMHWLGLGVGFIHQSEMFAAIDNTVTLPSFNRVDGAVFVKPHSRIGAQINLENVLNARYYPTSNGNNNIMPGAPRTIRLTLTAGM